MLICCYLHIALLFFGCGGNGGQSNLLPDDNQTGDYDPEVNEDGATIDPQGRLNITQYGITWTFDTLYTYGQFVNGDYWVMGPVVIVGMNPPSIDYNGRIVSGSLKIVRH